MKCSSCFDTSCWCAPFRFLFPCCRPNKPVIIRNNARKVDVVIRQVSREQLADALDFPRPLPLEMYSWSIQDGKIVEEGTKK